MKYRLLFCALLAAPLAACTGPVIIGSTAAGMYATSPGTPPPADLSLQIPPHESWCYSTSGYAECYTRPQSVPPERLINVDPPSAYPVDVTAYHQALKGKPAPTPVAVAQPESLQPVAVDAASMPPVTAQPVMSKKAKAAMAQPAVIKTPPPDTPEVTAEQEKLKDELGRENAAGQDASAQDATTATP